MLEALGLLDKIEPHATPCRMATARGVVIEPWLTDQWYVDAADAGQAGDRRGRGRARPRSSRKNWEKTYFEWMRNIQPWCISRQLWWGHQIPAWYGPDGKVFVARTSEALAPPSSPQAHYKPARVELQAATRTCSTPGSRRRCGRSRRWAGPSRRRN